MKKLALLALLAVVMTGCTGMRAFYDSYFHKDKAVEELPCEKVS